MLRIGLETPYVVFVTGCGNHNFRFYFSWIRRACTFSTILWDFQIWRGSDGIWRFYALTNWWRFLMSTFVLQFYTSKHLKMVARYLKVRKFENALLHRQSKVDSIYYIFYSLLALVIYTIQLHLVTFWTVEDAMAQLCESLQHHTIAQL